MKILHCLDSIDPALAGPVEAARQLTTAARDLGHEVEIVSLDPDPSRWTQSWPARVHAPGPAFSSYRYSPGLIPWFRANRGRWDAVVVHGVFKYHLIGAWRGLANSGTPYFVMLHGMLNPWFKHTYPLKHVKKSLFWHPLIHPAIRGAAAVLYLCEKERQSARLSFRIDSQSHEVAPLGIEGAPPLTGANAFAGLCPEVLGRRVILFLGRICAMKGCDVLLRAFAGASAADPSAILVIAGPDSEGLQSPLQELARKLGIAERVLWPGPLYGELKWDAYRMADAFILPSHCETFPVAVLEALSSSRPVLVTREVNICDEISRYRAGLVFDDDQDAVRRAIAEWLSISEAERRHMRENAMRCFSSEFHIAGALQKHLQVYNKYSSTSREVLLST